MHAGVAATGPQPVALGAQAAASPSRPGRTHQLALDARQLQGDAPAVGGGVNVQALQPRPRKQRVDGVDALCGAGVGGVGWGVSRRMPAWHERGWHVHAMASCGLWRRVACPCMPPAQAAHRSRQAHPAERLGDLRQCGQGGMRRGISQAAAATGRQRPPSAGRQAQDKRTKPARLAF